MQGKIKPPDLEMDARDAILRHGDGNRFTSNLTAAYAKTQPVKEFAAPDEEEGGS
jgi:hypothetical protein